MKGTDYHEELETSDENDGRLLQPDFDSDESRDARGGTN